MILSRNRRSTFPRLVVTGVSVALAAAIALYLVSLPPPAIRGKPTTELPLPTRRTATTSPVTGKRLTVDPNGEIKTIGDALRAAEAGDVIVISPGTYHGALRIKASGTRERPITIVAEQVGSVILDATGSGEAVVADGGDFITIKGLTVRGCNNKLANNHAAVRTGRGWRLEDVTIEQADGTGLSVFGDEVVLERVVSQDNGQAGIGGDFCSNVLVKDCVTRRNNRGLTNPAWKDAVDDDGNRVAVQHDGRWYVNPEWEAGGGKWWRSKSVTIDTMQAYDNVGPGIWFDYDNESATVRDCTVIANRGVSAEKAYQGAGILIELNRTGPFFIENNTAERNTGGNVVIAQSRNVNVRGNTFRKGHLIFRDYFRGAAYVIRDVVIENNVFDDAAVTTWEGDWNQRSGGEKNIRIDGNRYERGAYLFDWGRKQYHSLKEVREQLGFEHGERKSN